MQKRKLGRSGPEVPPIALGSNVYGWTVDEAAAFHQLDRAVAAGLNFIDTADVYSRWVPGHQGGESEAIIGKWLAKSGRRKDVLIATKVGMDMGDGKKGLRPEYIEQAVEASLCRLQTDTIDLYQAHTDDQSTLLEVTLTAFDKLIRQGKVRFIGASNYSGSRLAQAMEASKKLGVPSYVSLQPHYNLVHRGDFETDLLPVVQKYQFGVIPYFSLAAGFLTGKYRRGSDPEGAARGSMVRKYFNDQGFAIVDALSDVAAQHHATPAQVALAWLLAQPGVTAPIASATSDKHLDDLIAAAELQLDEASLRLLTDISAPVAA
ncbi:MAG TPA: aldo/keto reductase [Acidobacteriaceae bacterium]|jgi:aryl-alcohol dehydrogenase-like predicted oxidoreductase|nr:aldo/keto reductase [Acidobacteriaceae bacterium]